MCSPADIAAGKCGGAPGAASSADVPLNIYQWLASQSNSAEELQQKVAQWKAQQDALRAIAQAFPPSLRSTGVQIDDTHWVDRTTGTVWVLTNAVGTSGENKPGFTQMSDADSKRYITSIGGVPDGNGGTYPTTGGSTTRLASDDPRYWDFQYAQLNSQDKQAADQLAYQYANMGMTAENARRSALMAFIQARDSLASNTAQTSANVAKQIADYAANPRDTYAEAIYRNQVGGSTPFGDLQNQAFGDYGKALQQKGVNVFQNVAGDLDASRRYRDALPLQDWLPGGGAAQLNVGGSSGAPAQLNAVPDSMANANAAQQEALRQMEGNRQMMSATPEQQAAIQQIAAQRAKGQYYGFDSPEAAMAMQKYFAAKTPSTTPNLPAQLSLGGTGQPTLGGSIGTVDMNPPKAYAMGTRRHPVRVSTGGIMGGGGFDGGFATGGEIGVAPLTRFGGEQPSSSEGGLNLNIHELAHIVGQSGRVYASLGEGGYPEQVRITPTPSGKKAAQAAEKAGKSLSGTMGKAFAGGGTVNADPSIDDMNQQYSQLLERLGGQGGGSSTPFAGARFLAGAPANALLNDPFLKGVTEARYSTLPSLGGAGLAPEDLWAQIKSFTPQGIVGNAPRVSFA